MCQGCSVEMNSKNRKSERKNAGNRKNAKSEKIDKKFKFLFSFFEFYPIKNVDALIIIDFTLFGIFYFLNNTITILRNLFPN